MRRKDQVMLFSNKQVATQTKTQDKSVSQPEQMDNKTLLKLGGY